MILGRPTAFWKVINRSLSSANRLPAVKFGHDFRIENVEVHDGETQRVETLAANACGWISLVSSFV